MKEKSTPENIYDTVKCSAQSQHRKEENKAEDYDRQKTRKEVEELMCNKLIK